MKKNVFAFLLSVSLLVGIGMMPLSVNAQSDEILEFDINPEKNERIFTDTVLEGVRFVGCAAEGGTCLATIVIQG
ncbi:MAG: hypothetical protein HC912_00065 [Saprospiraceae bacterium]|nr:hypothetical protein [Saprospiraceae bacterium]